MFMKRIRDVSLSAITRWGMPGRRPRMAKARSGSCIRRQPRGFGGHARHVAPFRGAGKSPVSCATDPVALSCHMNVPP
ncbi:hypothetical protein BGC31_15885 [Komagataeibacter xylinus]|nr:hypothetical protein BFX83_03205 [Komagataeibacter xylinus]RFP07167.1 hypothetical protein BGC31_15885 [Komagataeibacter xylinus]